MRVERFLLRFLLLAILFVSLNASTISVEAADRKTRQGREAAAKGAQGERPQRGEPSAAEMIEMVRRAQETAEAARREAAEARARIAELESQIASLRVALATGDPASGGNGTEAGRQGIDAETAKLGIDAVAVKQESDAEAERQGGDAVAVKQGSDEERLARIEEQIEINSAQIREHAQTKVESDSRFRIRLTGMILANLHYNSDDQQRSAPLAAPPPGSGITRGTFGSTFRQTRVGLALSGPRVGGARLSGEVDFDFYGGTTGLYDGDLLGGLRVRTAAARLDWERTSLIIGQEAPIIAPRNPTSLASVWYPALSGAGNLWQWRPQVIVERRFAAGEKSELIAQGSLLPPFGDAIGDGTNPATPSYEARFAWRRELDAERAAEIGAGVHYNRRSFDFGRAVNGYVVAADWIVPLGEHLEVSGEAYHGRAIGLGEQSGARLDRVYAFNGPIGNRATRVRGVESSGGWMQLSVRPRADLEFNFAYGHEDPNNGDLIFGSLDGVARLRNQAGSINTIYQLRSNFLVSLEYRRLRTDYAGGRQTNNHYNLGVAYVF